MENISTALRTWRTKHSWKQDAVADRLGISRSQYSKIESGMKPLTLELLVSMAQLFRTSPSQLLDEILVTDGTPRPNHPNGASGAGPFPYGHADDTELLFYKKLAAFNEEKYLELYRLFLEKCPKDC